MQLLDDVGSRRFTGCDSVVKSSSSFWSIGQQQQQHHLDHGQPTGGQEPFSSHLLNIGIRSIKTEEDDDDDEDEREEEEEEETKRIRAIMKRCGRGMHAGEPQC